jgi:effector-binding domain-containing protein
VNVEIVSNVLVLNIHGFSGACVNQDYAGTAFRLMDKMWKIVKANNLKNKGLNIWVYEPNDIVFAGVELDKSPKTETGLEHKEISLKKYAYYKHIGPYNLIKKRGQEMKTELANRGFNIISPYIEIYGHWTNDETKLETELLMSLDTKSVTT